MIESDLLDQFIGDVAQAVVGGINFGGLADDVASVFSSKTQNGATLKGGSRELGITPTALKNNIKEKLEKDVQEKYGNNAPSDVLLALEVKLIYTK